MWQSVVKRKGNQNGNHDRPRMPQVVHTAEQQAMDASSIEAVAIRQSVFIAKSGNQLCTSSRANDV